MLERISLTERFCQECVQCVSSLSLSPFLLFCEMRHAIRSFFVGKQAFFAKKLSSPSGEMAWTQEDACQMKALLEKAGRNGLTPGAAMGLSPAAHDEEFEMVSHMTDASKRLGEDQLPLSTKMTKKSQQRFPDDESPLNSKAYVKEMLTSPYPGCSGEPPASFLPEGILSLSHCSSTEVRFGKFKGKGMCYAELFCSRFDEAISYLKCVRSCRSSAGGELAYLANYVRHMHLEEKKADPTIGDYIPGTSARRIFKA